MSLLSPYERLSRKKNLSRKPMWASWSLFERKTSRSSCGVRATVLVKYIARRHAHISAGREAVRTNRHIWYMSASRVPELRKTGISFRTHAFFSEENSKTTVKTWAGVSVPVRTKFRTLLCGVRADSPKKIIRMFNPCLCRSRKYKSRKIDICGTFQPVGYLNCENYKSTTL